MRRSGLPDQKRVTSAAMLAGGQERVDRVQHLSIATLQSLVLALVLLP